MKIQLFIRRLKSMEEQRIDFCEILTSVENTIKLSCRVWMVYL